MEEIRVRIPPSPTGKLHLGNAYTFLFNFLFARKNNGKLILRFEDSDQERSKKEFEEDITESLRWLGLKWDEGPFREMERLIFYKQAAEKLLAEEKAYYCFCTPEQLKAEKEELIKKGLPQVYSGKCRNLSKEQVGSNLKEEKPHAVRLKMPENRGKITFNDLVYGEISFDSSLIGDMIIMRSNGIPLYNFAVVVDDIDMKITHVLRAEGHISNTPKQVVIFEALGCSIPTFAHFPHILNPDRIGKLSKRYGSTAASDYKKDGYLPEAIDNYLSLLGWTFPDDREIMSMDEMVKEFDLSKIRKTPAAFDITKLEWLNGEYIRKMSDDELTTRLQEYLVDHPAKEAISKVVPLIKERIKKLSDFVPLTDFLWEKPEYDLEVFKKVKLGSNDPKVVLQKIAESLEKMPQPWNGKVFEVTFRKLAEDLEIKAGEMFQLIRVAVSGQLVSPPLFESIEILGVKETQDRIKEVTSKYPNF